MLKTDNNFLFESSKYEYKKQSLLRTTRRTKTANITKDDDTFAAQ